jgi:hypothetical protein
MAWAITRQRGAARRDQVGLIQINARRGWSAEAAIAPCTAVRDSPNFGPRGYCRGDFFAPWRSDQRPSRAFGRLLYPALLCPALSCAVLAGHRAGPDSPLAPLPPVRACMACHGFQPPAQHASPSMEGHPWVQLSLPHMTDNEVRRFGAGGVRMGADGATDAHASDTAAPSPPHPANGTLIRSWCRSLAKPVIGYWSRPVRRRLA